MANTTEKNVLLRLENVKMHFPLNKENPFSKMRQFVKAVDGVTLDIFEGETLGLVGESGCGKTTLGRVILQLYKQTDGTIRYTGITINDYCPKYAMKDAANVVKVRGTAEEILAKFPNQVKLCGGLLLHDNLQELAGAVRENLLAIKEVNKFQTAVQLLEIKRTAFLESAETVAEMRAEAEKDDEDGMSITIGPKSKSKEGKPDKRIDLVLNSKTRSAYLETGKKNSLKKIETKIEVLNAKLKKAEGLRDKKNAVLEEILDKCRGKQGFELLEENRDISIDLARLTKEEMRRQRRHLQIIFQDPYSSLNQRFSVGDIIGDPLIAHNMYAKGTREIEEYILSIMEKCGLQKYFLHRYPHQFSGGQRQRIGIARALASQPRFIVCDEPVSALDVSIQSQIINLLMDLKDSGKLTYLFISHDLSAVKFISDRVGVMYLGHLVELGTSDDLYNEPLHPYTNVLLKAIPTTDEASRKELQVIEGDIPSPVNPPPGCKFHTRCEYAQDICKTDVPEWRELRPEHWVACHFPVSKT